MSYKIMRVVVLFDLPTNTKVERHEATRFRNYLLSDGFDMLQYSVYTRICPDKDVAYMHINRVKRNTPSSGSVRALYLTENQFTNMYILVGEKTTQENVAGTAQLAFF